MARAIRRSAEETKMKTGTMKIGNMISRNILVLLREASAGLLAGAAAGIVLGIGARVAMRMVAVAVHFHPAMSLEGSLGVIIIGVVIGAVAGLIYAPLRRHLPFSE